MKNKINKALLPIICLLLFIACSKDEEFIQDNDFPKDDFNSTLKVYLKSNGDDSNSGLDFNNAVKTLNRVQEILYELNPHSEVEIHINQGTYLQQEVVWTFSNGKNITFTAIDFSKDRPIFDGKGRETWFLLREEKGINTNLHFRYIKVKNYKLGVYLRGDRCNPENGWNGNNHFYGMYFENIGNKFTIDKKHGVAAIDLVNSRSNSIINCHFVNIINSLPEEYSHLHAIYLAHYSSNNEILRNRIEKVCGDPIRVRDQSNYNIVKGNKFEKAGLKAFFSDWYCTGDRCSKPNSCITNPWECASYGNEFRDNLCNKNFIGKKPSLFKLYKEDDSCGNLPENRLRTSGNSNN